MHFVWLVSAVCFALPAFALPDCQANQTFDIVFSFDGSGSINAAEFKQQIQFIYDTINSMDVAPGKVHVGIVQWAEYTWTHLSLQPAEKTDVLEQICPGGVCTPCYFCNLPPPAPVETFRKSDCTSDVSNPSFLGDGDCDFDFDNLNSPFCNFDQGDCCAQTCPTCTQKVCLDPEFGSPGGKFAQWARRNSFVDASEIRGCAATSVGCQFVDTYTSVGSVTRNRCPANPGTCCFENGACLVPQLLGATLADRGLNQARLQLEGGGRPDVAQFIVFQTDGVFTDNSAALAESVLVKNSGIHVIGLAIGDQTDVNQVASVSSPGLIFELVDFSDFGRVIQPILDLSCQLSSNSDTPTASVTPSNSPTRSPTTSVTPTRTPSNTPTPSLFSSASPTPSQTPSSTRTPTKSPTQSVTPSVTPSSSATPSNTPSNSRTPTTSRTGSHSGTQSTTQTTTPTQTPSQTLTSTATPSQSQSPTGTSSQTKSTSETSSQTQSSSQSPSQTQSASQSASQSTTPSQSRTTTASASFSPSTVPAQNNQSTNGSTDSTAIIAGVTGSIAGAAVLGIVYKFFKPKYEAVQRKRTVLAQPWADEPVNPSRVSGVQLVVNHLYFANQVDGQRRIADLEHASRMDQVTRLGAQGSRVDLLGEDSAAANSSLPTIQETPQS